MSLDRNKVEEKQRKFYSELVKIEYDIEFYKTISLFNTWGGGGICLVLFAINIGIASMASVTTVTIWFLLKREIWGLEDKSEKLNFRITNREEVLRAFNAEKNLDYETAILIFEKGNLPDEAGRIRRKMRDENKINIAQKVVHGDSVTHVKEGNQFSTTKIEDSVINRSNVGGGGSSKMQELKELREMRDSGDISDDEFKQMKKEILGK